MRHWGISVRDWRESTWRLRRARLRSRLEKGALRGANIASKNVRVRESPDRGQRDRALNWARDFVYGILLGLRAES